MEIVKLGKIEAIEPINYNNIKCDYCETVFNCNSNECQLRISCYPNIYYVIIECPLCTKIVSLNKILIYSLEYDRIIAAKNFNTPTTEISTPIDMDILRKSLKDMGEINNNSYDYYYRRSIGNMRNKVIKGL